MKHMSGAIMTLIFLGVPFLVVFALLVRGALRTVQEWRFARMARLDGPGSSPSLGEPQPPEVRVDLPPVRRPGPPRLG